MQTARKHLIKNGFCPRCGKKLSKAMNEGGKPNNDRGHSIRSLRCRACGWLKQIGKKG